MALACERCNMVKTNTVILARIGHTEASMDLTKLASPWKGTGTCYIIITIHTVPRMQARFQFTVIYVKFTVW
jgi:3,4-dihydroxy-2-butanone 4-phosphate synthase